VSVSLRWGIHRGHLPLRPQLSEQPLWRRQPLRPATDLRRAAAV